MLISFATDQIKLVRAPRVPDNHGNEVLDWAQAERTPVEGCSVQPGPSQEVELNREAYLIAWTVLAPPGLDVTALDRVEWQGLDYDVWGEPQPWNGPSDMTSHTLIYLRLWEG